MQMLHCIKQVPSEGGENVFSDGFRAAIQLKESHPEFYDILSNTIVDFFDDGSIYYEFYHMNRMPTIGYVLLIGQLRVCKTLE